MKRSVLLGMAALALCQIPAQLRAESPAVPQVIGFHSVIADEGGNPIPDGDVTIDFRITDAAGTVLYEERQGVASVGGLVSALIGNGLTGDGAPTGGVPMGVLDPQGARFIEVAVEGVTTLPPMEIASVPYAAYAQEALGVADGSVSFESLDADAMQLIAQALTKGKDASQILLRDELPTLYSASSAASTIGVAPGLAYSGASHLQETLGDLDKAIVARDARINTEINDRSSAIAAEAQARTGADSSEAGSRLAADSSEAGVRSAADSSANSSIVDLQGRMQAIENPQRLSFNRSAWGTVSLSGGNAVMHGANASAAYLGSSLYRITFDQQMADDLYAVAVTPANNSNSQGGAYPLSVSSKDAGGFTISLGNMSPQKFDFVVMGN
ncbi:MAG: hypothetical protein WC956_02005 [bacterium]